MILRDQCVEGDLVEVASIEPGMRIFWCGQWVSVLNVRANNGWHASRGGRAYRGSAGRWLTVRALTRDGEEKELEIYYRDDETVRRRYSEHLESQPWYENWVRNR